MAYVLAPRRLENWYKRDWNPVFFRDALKNWQGKDESIEILKFYDEEGNLLRPMRQIAKEFNITKDQAELKIVRALGHLGKQYNKRLRNKRIPIIIRKEV